MEYFGRRHLSSTTGSGTDYTAPLSPASATVTATVGSAQLSVGFGVIPPSSVVVVGLTNIPLGTEVSDGDTMGARTIYSIIICPTNVSFSRVQFRENPDPSSIDVTWPVGIITTFPLERTTTPFSPPCGVLPIYNDKIETVPVWGSYLCTGTGCSDKSITSSWTDQYMNDSSEWTDFYSISVQYDYFSIDFKCRITYLGVHGSRQGPYVGSH